MTRTSYEASVSSEANAFVKSYLRGETRQPLISE